MPSKYLSKLRDKRVLVLGATSGIGYCVAESALEHGACVIISGSRQNRIDSTIERLLQDYPDAKHRLSGYPCDLLADDAEKNVVALLDFATKDGKLDHIAKTSGDNLGFTKLADLTRENFQQAQAVRVYGSLLIGKYLKNYMNDGSGSSYTVTGGVNYHKPSPGWAVQATAGAGIDGLARALAVDLKPIRVNCVAPGAIGTETWDQFRDPAVREQAQASFTSKQLIKELGKPEDTAEAYLYFMKDNFVDGQTLLTDGGLILGA